MPRYFSIDWVEIINREDLDKFLQWESTSKSSVSDSDGKLLLLLDPKCPHCLHLWQRLCLEGTTRKGVGYKFVYYSDIPTVSEWLKPYEIDEYPRLFPHTYYFQCQPNTSTTLNAHTCKTIKYDKLEKLIFE